ncbi:MAG: type III restriction endonuclease subunit R [Candidatus Muproteobacteria bacterium RIFCSPHIGHO2_01_FULL_65_16]|uniref:Type III restriction endonuclease subunit R n=1 Tax=Candidatus Muproteobacteria bacterium RIFCSPHIGHO2_01_FULL_65_16 TaxID=1817764 RepID=A0A1F6THB1_9PROT|nr:MAG: type III restriction endonuclease subunit R [Candidatus Muproteobacteria bacterium RIFCSPHIGHO2_01_FULL_65_16]
MTIDRLIVNTPYKEPRQHWGYQRETRTFRLEDGRRAAGYVVASPDSRAFDDPGIFVEIPLVNQIRPRVKAWREAGYPGVTSITKRLLEHWYDPEEFNRRRFFFCQLEAIETLIWLTEAPAADKVGIEIPSDGGPFQRLCTKLATGGGKTLVMAMLIAWQILNKVAYAQDARFSKSVLIIAPGLTVKSRLAVLDPNNPANYYQGFSIVPVALLESLRQGRVLIHNWHTLGWETEEKLAKKRSVDKRGAKSDEAYVREVLGELSNTKNLLVINDEAHHAWRIPADTALQGVSRDDIEEATKWVGGLDRIHRARGVLSCYDFSATPFIPSGHRAADEALFGWIVSDFGLNDAIESGLVKTPRVVVRDDAVPDARTYKSRLYHLYNDREVKDDLNRRAEPQEPLPDLVTNAYHLLGYDWRSTAETWQQAGAKTPPVMITVANRTETAARVKYAFDHRRIQIPELCDPDRALHIDSKVLDEAEAQDEPVETVAVSAESENEGDEAATPKLTKKQQAERLRQLVDTVGQIGKPGETIQNVISVGMLSEGWDAKTVTHIMGLRAFTSQLLCEQVIGRGLRRTAYEVNPDTGLFEAEYVNVFGVPFSFLPHEGEAVVTPTPPKTRIEPVPDKMRFEIRWPNVIRIDHVYRPNLSLDQSKIVPLELSAADTIRLAALAPVVEGRPDVTKISSIELDKLAREFRTQRIVFETARDIFSQMQPNWAGSREFLLAQIVRLVEQFITSDRIRIKPALFEQDDLKRRLLITLNMTKVVQHIWEAIRFENTEGLEPVFDSSRPIRSTGDMAPWYTSKPCEFTLKSHINFCVMDSTWESSEAFAIDQHPAVDAWAKNDHLGFDVFYVFRGVVRKYRPDFLIRLSNGDNFILETKGKDTDQDKTKRRFLDEWVRAVNEHGGFGKWRWDVSLDPADVADVIARHTTPSLERV